MSNLPDTTVADGRRPGKSAERSNFSLTCNLVSQFLKEKRSSGGLSLGIAGKMESGGTSKNLLTSLGNSEAAIEFLPQFVENPCIKQSDNRSRDPSGASQLTLFYAGKVLVFDAFPAEKATEIMELATKLCSDSSETKQKPPSASVATENVNAVKEPQINTDQEVPRPGTQSIGSDMRYPRRASLLKFLEKRKERVMAKGPYHFNNPMRVGPSKHGENSSEDDHGDQSGKQFDLNL
ncbi:hypothetical protein L6164_004185 [Bauhinia variegata]|uniref:Uncharacterized protein n=1 Tax=Bauhinia variegata TaxID=167791 RepID=A0ACB9Q3L9_BAUVA|nr:hypothetical protein L6164_004185 [Bauhinia variegata]